MIGYTPLLENTAKPDTDQYYDMTVLLYIKAFSPENGDALQVIPHGFFETNYCSNQFIDCMCFNGISPADTSYYADINIKQEYNAAQLLEYYRQGLKLQM